MNSIHYSNEIASAEIADLKTGLNKCPLSKQQPDITPEWCVCVLPLSKLESLIECPNEAIKRNL